MDEGISTFGIVITTVAVVLTFLIPLTAMISDHRRRKMLHEERRLMIERGMTPPPVPPAETMADVRLKLGLDEPVTQKSLDGAFRRGILLTFLGAGMGIGYIPLSARAVQMGDIGELAPVIGAAGAIVGMLGIGNLVYQKIARGRLERDTTVSDSVPDDNEPVP